MNDLARYQSGPIEQIRDKVMDDLVESVYRTRLAQAQEVAKIKTDEELKEYLINHDAKGQMPSEGMLRDWRSEVLPKLTDFANGKPSKEEFSRDFRKTEDVQGDKVTRLKDSLGFFTFFWLLLGVSTAYKLGAG